MTEAPDNHLRPSAQFLVERVPGTGYCVTSSHGPDSPALEKEAIALLDRIEQPDSTCEDHVIEWVRPVSKQQYLVGVTTIVRSTGESRYSQSWFRAKPFSQARTFTLAGIILPLILGIAIGAFAGTMFCSSEHAPRSFGTLDAQKDPLPNAEDTKPKLTTEDATFTRVSAQLSATQEVRNKIEEYLQQDGLAADPSLPVVEEQRSVKLIADLDRSPPPRESIRLSNIEVLGLLKLLDQLSQLEPNQGSRIEE